MASEQTRHIIKLASVGRANTVPPKHADVSFGCDAAAEVEVPYHLHLSDLVICGTSSFT